MQNFSKYPIQYLGVKMASKYVVFDKIIYTIKSGNFIKGYMYFFKETHNRKNAVQEQDC